MFIGEADTGEPFSIGLKLGKSTYYLKAENRLELDNWSRVLKPFVQASQAFIPRRSSSSSSAESDVFAHSESNHSVQVKKFCYTRIFVKSLEVRIISIFFFRGGDPYFVTVIAHLSTKTNYPIRESCLMIFFFSCKIRTSINPLNPESD